MKKLILLFVLLAAAAGGFWFFQERREDALVLDTTAIKRGDLIKAVSSTGTLEAVNTVNVGAQVSGTINTIYVDYNSVVQKGDLLAEIDPSLLRAKTKQAEANVLAAKAALQETRANARNAKKSRDRNKELFAKHLIAESALDSSQTEYETSLAKVTSAKASLAQAEANLEYDSTNLGYTRITSPIQGVITDRAVDEGQTVNASQSAPDLFTIAEDLTKMQVATEVDEADIGQVKAGQAVEFTVDAYPTLSFEGKVNEIRLAPSTSDSVVSYTVIVKVDNPELKLMPGMTANVSIISDKKEDVFKVASSALRFSPGKDLMELSSDSGVAEGSPPRNPQGSGMGKGQRRSAPGENSSFGTLWLYEEGTFRPVRVKVGISDGMYTQVEGELEEGMNVITAMTGSGGSSKGGGLFGFGPRR